MKSGLPEYITFLLNRENYPHRPEDVHLVQTHISYVLIAGEFVYKWKKEVDFGFLDFSTFDKRAHFCEQELLLNRRLCPDIYLDVVTINRAGDGTLALAGEGEVVEYGVKMARMDESQMMASVIARGELTRKHLDGIIGQLVPFYRNAANDDSIKEFGRAQSVAVNVLENFDQTESFVGTGGLGQARFELICNYAKDFLDDLERFDRRVAQGKVRDCHGDLYSANICLDETIHIFDCIEFNERFRYSDVAADIAFLAMDLDYHGLTDFSSYFVDSFADKSGDDGLKEMLNFYKCYRAYVRGKIGLFTAADPEVDTQTAQNCTAQASRYFELAEQYARS